MNLTFLIIDLFYPFLFILIWGLYKYKTPRKPNMWYGHRTTRTLRSKEAWEFAHLQGSKYWLNTGVLLLVIVIINRFFFSIDSEVLTWLHLSIAIIGYISCIFIVEKKLKENFD